MEPESVDHVYIRHPDAHAWASLMVSIKNFSKSLEPSVDDLYTKASTLLSRLDQIGKLHTINKPPPMRGEPTPEQSKAWLFYHEALAKQTAQKKLQYRIRFQLWQLIGKIQRQHRSIEKTLLDLYEGHITLPKPQADFLPSGWECRKTHTGRPYYVDHLTQTTSWTPPRPPSQLRKMLLGSPIFLYTD